MTGRPLSVSIVVPAYNEAARIEASVRTLAAWMRAHLPAAELLVVDDGSRDGTPAILARLACSIRALRVIRLPRNRGKGAAVREGLRRARGKAILFTDADLSTAPSEIPRALRQLAAGADVAIGSRHLAGSRLPIPQPLTRRLGGRVFNLAAKILLGLPYADTQCGFKAFSRAAARRLAAAGREDGFAFDLELLLLARRFRLAVTEFPITWSDRAFTTVSLARHAPRMFRAILTLQRRLPDTVIYHPARALPLILFSCACAVVGQILYKIGARAIPPLPFGADFLVAMASSHWIQGGLVFFMSCAVTWILALARVDLSFAFPMLSLNFVFTALYAWLWFGEHLSPARVGGIAFVIAGVMVIASGGQAHPARGKDVL